MIDPVIALLIALAGALLFGSAAFHKLRALSVFVGTFTEYRILPLALVPPTAYVVVAIEGVLSIGLVWSATRVASAIAGAVLLLIYAAAIGVNLLRGRRDIDCGCTLQHRPIGAWMIVRNVLLAALLLSLALPVSGRPLGLPDLAMVAAALLVITLLYASADLLLGRTHSRPGYSMETP